MKLTTSETNNAIVARLKNVRKHPNADRLQLATIVGDTVIVDLNAQEGDLVLYFDSNLCLAPDYLRLNNLYSNPEMNVNKEKRGYFGNQGRVRAQRLRGEKSYGFATELDTLAPLIGNSYTQLKEGNQFTHINDAFVCKKYLVPIKPVTTVAGKKARILFSPMFVEHWDTKQFFREFDQINLNQTIYIEEKLHGTSQRSGFVLANRDLGLFERLLLKLGIRIEKQEWRTINGSRRVILTSKSAKDGWYKGDVRDVWFDRIKGNLHKGEQVFYEIVGYDTNGSAIQSGFPYGCQIGESRAILYRVTQNGVDGKVYDMGREYVYRRADELGMERPPLLRTYYFGPDDRKSYDIGETYLEEIVKVYTDGQSVLDEGTLREGVVVWFLNNEGRWMCLKNKSFAFLEHETKQRDMGQVDIEDTA